MAHPEMVAPRALVFGPLVKRNEDSGNEIAVRVIWMCACVRYRPDRGLVFECVTCF